MIPTKYQQIRKKRNNVSFSGVVDRNKSFDTHKEGKAVDELIDFLNTTKKR